MEDMINLAKYKGKTVLVTGHTGFKGAWLSIWLTKLGAKVVGFSLKDYPNDFIFRKAELRDTLIDERGDLTDFEALKKVFEEYKPDVVFHLAAQPLVRKGYDQPLKTYSTNIIGTINVLELIRKTESIKAGIIITSDKCYKNKEFLWGYREVDELGGFDPYGSSKACAELVIESYRESFFKETNKLVASVRAGNVIGGGDFSEDRLVPDCVKSLLEKKDIEVRSPSSTRPWQHVLEPLSGYLMVGQKLIEGKAEFATSWNFGPNYSSVLTVEKVVELITSVWGSGKYKVTSKKDGKYESKALSLDSSKAKALLKWRPKLDIATAIKLTVDWYKKAESESVYELCLKQIKFYEELKND